MTPKLQSELIKVCLVSLETKFKQFFDQGESTASRPFINRLLSNMKCRMQRVGTPIIKQGETVDKVYFFYNGNGILQRQFTSLAYGVT